MKLDQVLTKASAYWGDAAGGRVMAIRAARCAEVLGRALDAGELVRAPGDRPARLLQSLREEGLSRASIAAYYAAFKRALALSGFTPIGWPRAQTPPRKTKGALSSADAQRLLEWLNAKGWSETGDLVVLLRGTGLRVRVEALSGHHITPHLMDGPYDVLHVTGKGGHEREIPVVDKETRSLLRDEARLAAMRGVTYEGHLRRWRRGCLAVGITSGLATPHAIRHGYATEALSRSGNNLALVQELLGHSNPGTTARYLDNKLGEKAKALASSG